jgi:hypothetical protein
MVRQVVQIMPTSGQSKGNYGKLTHKTNSNNKDSNLLNNINTH